MFEVNLHASVSQKKKKLFNGGKNKEKYAKFGLNQL